MLEFRYSRSSQSLFVGEEKIEDPGGEDWSAPRSLVEGASLASFRRAVLDMANYWDNDELPAPGEWGMPIQTMYVSEIDAEDFDPEYSPVSEVALDVLTGGTSVVIVQVEVVGMDLTEDDFPRLLAPLLDRSKATLIDVALEGYNNVWVAILRLAYGPRGATVGDALAVGDNVHAFLSQLRDGALTVDSAWNLLAAGRGELLLGLPESKWLDVKSQGYDLSGDAGKIELAQDVSRFANGDCDALLVIGFRAAKQGPSGDEVITAVTASLAPFKVQQYHQVIDARVFPPVLGLTIEGHQVALRGDRVGHLLTIRVPAQSEESKPFLVHGAIVAGQVEGAFISIVQRRGEHSIPITGPSIHSTLAAGRALLRRGVVPPAD